MPKCCMDKIQNVYDNILYPKRLVSTLVQGDFKSAGSETVRFLTNSTIGLGGMFDTAKKYLKIEPKEADMEQALAKCKVKTGPYVVCPVLSATSPRAILGKILDAALDPTTYLGLPIATLVRLGLSINKTAYMQPVMIFLESNFADPYDVTRKFYSVDNYIRNNQLVETEVSGIVLGENSFFDFWVPNYNNTDYDFVCLGNTEQEKTVYEELVYQCQPELTVDDGKILAKIETEKFNLETDTEGLKKEENLAQQKVKPDIILENFNPQSPVIDAMRTAFFDLPGIDESVWSELSVWNRSFSRRLKTSEVNLAAGRPNYKFRYILQQDRTAPIVLIYPSIGEGYMSHHSVVLAKLFYDKGYSVIIQGSHFQWEFVKSMPKGLKPGIPARDVKHVQLASSKIVNYLQDKYNCRFGNKIVIGTSFGAMMALFLADLETKEPVLGISKYIAVNPPVELIYAMNQFDKNTGEWDRAPNAVKEKAAIAVSKIMKILDSEEMKNEKKEDLPFSEEEAKLITGYVMHQKLSDLIFTIEEGQNQKNKSELYKMIYGMNYNDYVVKYLLAEEQEDTASLNNITSLHNISSYLQNHDNYKIYHSADDYLVNNHQLLQLKNYCQNKLIIMSNGSHLGFLYRQEFIDSLKNEIPENKLKTKNKEVEKNGKHELVSVAK